MWFKNLYLFRLTAELNQDHNAFNEALQGGVFTPCSKIAPSSYGWVPPLGRDGTDLCHSVAGYTIFCARKEEKILPASVVNEFLNDKVVEIEEREDRKVGRKEKQTLKEELIFELLPQAFSRRAQTFGYMDHKHGWLVIDAANAKKAEEFWMHLRKSLLDMKTRLPETVKQPTQLLTLWLRGEGVPDDYVVGDEFELVDRSDDGGVIRCKRQDPLSDEVQTHLEAGKEVSKLALNWQDKINFVAADDLTIKRLRFTDSFQEENDSDDSADAATRFDTDFVLMSMELSKFITDLINGYGGEKPTAL